MDIMVTKPQVVERVQKIPFGYQNKRTLWNKSAELKNGNIVLYMYTLSMITFKKIGMKFLGKGEIVVYCQP